MIRLLVCTFLLLFASEPLSATTYIFKQQGDTTSISEQYNLSIQLNQRVDTFIVPNIPHLYWETDVLVLRSNQTFMLEQGVVLHASKNCFPKKNTSYGLFRLNNIDNVKIIGNHSEIKFDINEYDDGEWRHAIFVEGVHNLTISGLTISGAAGDGICINWNSARICSENVTIRDLILDGNARQGISVISVKNLLVDGCTFKNTGRFNHHQLATHGPWSGIDLEPDSVLQVLVDVQITNCFFEGNKGDGLLIAFAGGKNRVKVAQCSFKDNRSAVALIGPVRGDVGSFVFNELKVTGNHQYGFYFRDWTWTKQKVNFSKINLSGTYEYVFRLETTDKSKSNKVGNIAISNLSFTGEYTKGLYQDIGTGTYQSTKIRGKRKYSKETQWQNFVIQP